jgi:hypothetical protein
MATFEYRQAEEVRDAFARNGCRYLFIGNSAVVLLGFPDTTQEVALFVDESAANGPPLVKALGELGFTLTGAQTADILRGKDFVQIKDGPFDLDLIFAPDGIERFEDAWNRRINVAGFEVCNLDDIIASKVASSGRRKDRESLPRLESFRNYWNSING